MAYAVRRRSDGPQLLEAVEGEPAERDGQPVRRETVEQDRRDGGAAVDPDGDQAERHGRLDAAQPTGRRDGGPYDGTGEVDDGDGGDRCVGAEGARGADEGG